MKNEYKFLSLVLDSITEHIVVIDEQGAIQYVNQSWLVFGSENACVISDNWRGVNYLDECDKAAAMGDETGKKAGTGIRNVIAKRNPVFTLEYPCHSPDDKRWFMMRVTPLKVPDENYVVVSHQNITERKLAEQKVENLAKMDGLTGIPNRRAFDEFLSEEWRRCSRSGKPVSLALVDLDYFKLLNDNYGHQYGDECLVKVGALLKDLSKRPGDICARYGGEEFALVWSHTSLQQAKMLAGALVQGIAALGIENSKSPVEEYLTASIGVAETVPGRGTNESEIIARADEMLYRAKEKGRNRLEC